MLDHLHKGIYLSSFPICKKPEWQKISTIAPLAKKSFPYYRLSSVMTCIGGWAAAYAGFSDFSYEMFLWCFLQLRQMMQIVRVKTAARAPSMTDGPG